MTILPINPAAPENTTPAALLAFLEQCRAMAVALGRPRLISISLEVPALDPLAVLESIFEPDERHFYIERPAENFALAGAEAVHSFTSHGPSRFADCQSFIDATLADAIAVGNQTAAFSGPHFFTAYSFFNDTEPGEPFESASIFVPRWQVARANGRTTAVANFVIPPAPDADLRALAEKVLRAKQKFIHFEYAPAQPAQSRQHGQSGWHEQFVWHGRLARDGSGDTGVSPVMPANAHYASSPADIQIRQGAYLPHWTRASAIYSVTFRLADSLPQTVLQGWLAERQDIIDTALQQKRLLSQQEIERINFLHSQKIENYLDTGAGECLMRDERIAQSVRDALLHFHQDRYTLHAWCVMPNHVHVIVQPHAGHQLPDILHSWKSFTAHSISRILQRKSAIWQTESYDHLIRDASDYSHAIDYVMNNPVKAALMNWKWAGRCEGSMRDSMGETPMSPEPHGRDARATRTTRSTHFDYRAAVSCALELISRGAFQKIVLARTLDFSTPDATPLHPLRVLNTLRERFTDCYSFSLANGHGQSFIGASPERLLRVRDHRLLTEALAGSAPRGATASEDAALGGALLRSEKDTREQRLVLDSILRRLEPLGLKLTHPSQPGLRKLANVQHLHTPVEAMLPKGDDSNGNAPRRVRLLDALARLHPTPAVGGSPRDAAIAHIRELESFPRGLYAGAIGWIDSRGDGEFFVGLRSALIDGANARLYAGAGIVAGSSPDKEYDETEIKLRAIHDALLT